jgi:small subunit ribosomal protein S21
LIVQLLDRFILKLDDEIWGDAFPCCTIPHHFHEQRKLKRWEIVAVRQDSSLTAIPRSTNLTLPIFQKVGEFMPEVIVRKGEPIDRALKRLKSKLDAEGLMDEVRRLRAFETPTQRSRRKAKNNAKRAKMKIRFNFNPVS